MSHEGFPPNSSREAAPPPLPPEKARALADYIALLGKVNSAGPELIGLDGLRTLARLRKELGDDTIKTHVNAFDTNGPIFF